MIIWLDEGLDGSANASMYLSLRLFSSAGINLLVM